MADTYTRSNNPNRLSANAQDTPSEQKWRWYNDLHHHRCRSVPPAVPGIPPLSLLPFHTYGAMVMISQRWHISASWKVCLHKRRPTRCEVAPSSVLQKVWCASGCGRDHKRVNPSLPELDAVGSWPWLGHLGVLLGSKLCRRGRTSTNVACTWQQRT